jgi:hypothetical protein
MIRNSLLAGKKYCKASNFVVYNLILKTHRGEAGRTNLLDFSLFCFQISHWATLFFPIYRIFGFIRNFA